MRRMAAIDAQNWWMSAKLPNDQFLLYGFDGVPDDLAAAEAEVRGRAQRCPDLAVGIRDDCRLTYPARVPRAVGDDQFVRYDGALQWNECLDVVAGLADHQLDAAVAPWRLHVFACVRGIPGATAATGTVAVLQVSTRSPTAPAPRRWPRGCSGAPARSFRCRRNASRPRACRGVPCERHARIGSWCA